MQKVKWSFVKSVPGRQVQGSVAILVFGVDVGAFLDQELESILRF
jgi:hypothetical protein